MPRQVVVDLLGLPAEMADWKKCAVDENAETLLVETYKARFEAWDPSE
jgi:hypothetical protein